MFQNLSDFSLIYLWKMVDVIWTNSTIPIVGLLFMNSLLSDFKKNWLNTVSGVTLKKFQVLKFEAHYFHPSSSVALTNPLHVTKFLSISQKIMPKNFQTSNYEGTEKKPVSSLYRPIVFKF